MSLAGSHVLVVSDSPEDLQRVQEALQGKGVMVHTATSRMEAFGLLVQLFAQQIIPRALITDWMLNLPDSKDYEFYQVIDKPQENTAQTLIKHVRAYDDQIAIMVFTDFADLVPLEDIKEHGYQLISKSEGVDAMLKALQHDPRVQDMRYRASKSQEFAMATQEIAVDTDDA